MIFRMEILSVLPWLFLLHQEDISKLRRKIEKAKKPAESMRNGDEILNEEINEYKVRNPSGKVLFKARLFVNGSRSSARLRFEKMNVSCSRRPD